MNKYGAWLLRGGVAGVAGGLIVAIVAGRMAERDARMHEIFLSLGGFGTDDSAAPAFMWFGIIVAILGVVAVIAYLATRTQEKSP